MKMTIILNDQGDLVAAHQGDSGRDGNQAGLVAGPGQKLHVVDVPDHVAKAQDPDQFLIDIKSHLPKP